MSLQALQNAYDTIHRLTGEPPGRFVIGPPVTVIETGPGEVVLPEHTWRAAVEEHLAIVWSGKAPDGMVDVSMRKDGWRVLGVPVDTSRLR